MVENTSYQGDILLKSAANKMFKDIYNKKAFSLQDVCISFANLESVNISSSFLQYHGEKGNRGKQIASIQIGAALVTVLMTNRLYRERLPLICQTCSDIKNARAFRTDNSGGIIRLQVSSKIQCVTVCFSSL